MTAGSALRELGAVLDDVEQTAGVSGVELVEVTVEPGAGALTAEVQLTVSTGPTDTGSAIDTEDGPDTDTDTDTNMGATAVRPAPTVDADGRLRLAFETVDPLVSTTDGVTVEPVTVSPAGEERLVATLSVAVSTGRTPATDAPCETTTRPHEPESDRSGTDADTETDTGADTETGTETDTDTDAGDGRRGTRAPADTGANDGRATSDRTGSGDGREPVGHQPVGRDRSVPPFRDPELLAAVYDAHETFAEMATALDMDVTAETVRRYMIDAGVHQPASYDTGGTDSDDDVSDAGESATDSDRGGSTEEGDPPDSTDIDESPVVLADGIGLPNDITVETLVETVKRSNTVHEVERAVGVDHDDALELLRELNLLDLVVGRLATEAERDISRAEVVERLREASTTR